MHQRQCSVAAADVCVGPGVACPRHPTLQVDTEELRKLKRVDAAAISKKKKLSEMDVLAVVQNDSTYLEVGGC